MTRDTLRFPALAAAPLAFILGAAPLQAYADENEAEIPFSVANIFFELNNTDGDLGIHALIDGKPWKKLEIEEPNEREMLNIRLRGQLRRQGLTELFFESAEPPFESDEPGEVSLTPEKFFKRFQEGQYEVSGITIEGDELNSTAMVTHLMPAPPEIFVSDPSESPQAVSDDCDEDPGPAVSNPVTVSWSPITKSHPEIGRTGESIEIKNYELVVEREMPSPLKFTAILSPDVTSVQLPAGLLGSGDKLKVEVLAREKSDNQTATESCFQVKR